MQHEVVEGLSVAFGYNRNWDGIFQVTENTLVGPNDYDEFCITSPVDPRLPGGGGQNLCGFYDIKPQFFGQGQLRVTNSAEFGKQQRYWDGFTFNARGPPAEKRFGSAAGLTSDERRRSLLHRRYSEPAGGTDRGPARGRAQLPDRHRVERSARLQAQRAAFRCRPDSTRASFTATREAR